MVAAFHSLVGLAACTTSIANVMLAEPGHMDSVHKVGRAGSAREGGGCRGGVLLRYGCYVLHAAGGGDIGARGRGGRGLVQDVWICDAQSVIRACQPSMCVLSRPEVTHPASRTDAASTPVISSPLLAAVAQLPPSSPPPLAVCVPPPPLAR